MADASPLIAFGRLNLLAIFNKTLGSIIIPESVANECMQDKLRPGAQAIQVAVQNKKIEVHADPITDQFTQLTALLGKGESAAIVLALELPAGLLVDERLARNTAIQLNVKVIGTAGVLLLAKQKRIITEVLPIIKQLKESGYYLADSLVKEVAKIAHESI